MKMVKINKINKTAVLALAKTRKEGIAVLESLEETLKHHLFKVILFPDRQEIRHYVKEIQNYVRKFSSITLKKGYLDFNTIYNVLYDDLSNDIEGQLRNYALELREDGYSVSDELLNRDFSDPLEKMEQFYKDLAMKLERKYQGHHNDIIVEFMLKECGLLS